MTKTHNVSQKSVEWTELRLGRLTASRFKKIIDLKKMSLKSPDVVLTSVAELLSEIETGFAADSGFVTDAMQWGLDNEQEYKDEYLYKDGFEDLGFATNDKFPLVGCSPDSIHTSGKLAVEIKCLNSANHIKICIKDEIPKEYLPQIWMYFIVFEELEKLQFVSYDPRNLKRPVFKKIISRSDISTELEKVAEVIKEYSKLVEQYQLKN